MMRGHVIVKTLRQVKPYEANYPTHELESGAVILALEIWIHYLCGVKCAVYNEHKSL